MKKLSAWIQKNERHLSSLAIIVGFIGDAIAFPNIEIDLAVLILGSYLVIAAGCIVILHIFEGIKGGGFLGRMVRQWFPLITAFALGGLLSAFLAFYSFTGSIAKSWPLVILVAAIMIGNEWLRSYRSRLPFQTSILFLVSFSFAALVTPLYVHHIGPDTFTIAGAATVAAFWLFIELLGLTSRKRYSESRKSIIQGAAAVFVIVNILYFTNTIPPIPISLKSSGVYHSVVKNGSDFTVTYEPQPWYAFFSPEVIHVGPHDTVYALSAVFAPSLLSTTVVHRWEKYDPLAGVWTTDSIFSFAIEGGRDGGYRGYTAKPALTPGTWRVSVETPRGEVIGRITFSVVAAGVPPALRTKVIQ